MAATPMISPAAAKAGLNAITALFNSGVIDIRSGALEGNTGDSDTGTLLSSGCTFGSTAFAAAVDGGTTGIMTSTANAIASDTNAAASGTAGHFRIKVSGTVVAQGTCDTSAADMIFNTTTINAGDTIAITSFTISIPDGSGND